MTTGCCWPLLPVRPPRDGAFFVRPPVGVNGASLQENAPEASTKQKAPGLRRGLCLTQLGQLAYRAAAVTAAASLLTLRLAPPLGPLSGPLPRTSPLETSLTQSEPLPL